MCMTLLPAPTSPPSPRRDGDPTWSSTPPGNRTQPVRGSPIDSEIPNDDIQARHDSGAAPSPVNNDPLALWLPAARAGCGTREWSVMQMTPTTPAGRAPEWTMGLGFLALAGHALGEAERAI